MKESLASNLSYVEEDMPFCAPERISVATEIDDGEMNNEAERKSPAFPQPTSQSDLRRDSERAKAGVKRGSVGRDSLVQENIERDVSNGQGASLPAGKRASMQRQSRATSATTAANAKKTSSGAIPMGRSSSVDINPPAFVPRGSESLSTLTPTAILAECFTNNPKDVYSCRFVGRELERVKGDFSIFTNLSHMNCSDNVGLSLEQFSCFPRLVALQLAMNDLTHFSFTPSSFSALAILDLSYNQLTDTAILALALLPNLVALDLSGNYLKSLPLEMSGTSLVDEENTSQESNADAFEVAARVRESREERDEKEMEKDRAECVPPSSALIMDEDSRASKGTGGSKRSVVHFAHLENLILDHNEIDTPSVFAALAGLPHLRYVSLAHNRISYVPHLVAAPASTETGRNSMYDKNEPFVRNEDDEALLNEHGDSENRHPEGSDDDFNPHKFSQGTVAAAITEATSTTMTLLVEPRSSVTDMHSHTSVTTTNVDSPSNPIASQNPDAMPPIAAFPMLEVLNLNHNLLRASEDVLEVANWPSIRALHVVGNAITLYRKGLPEELIVALRERRGIQVVNKLVKPKRPHIRMDPQNMVKVGPALPRIPKQADHITLLPPISLPTIEPPMKDDKHGGLSPDVQGAEEVEEEPEGNGFFMTQTDDVYDEEMIVEDENVDRESAAVETSSFAFAGLSPPNSNSTAHGTADAQSGDMPTNTFRSRQSTRVAFSHPNPNSPSPTTVHFSSRHLQEQQTSLMTQRLPSSLQLYTNYAVDADFGFEELRASGDGDEAKWKESFRRMPADILSLSHALKFALQHPDNASANRAPQRFVSTIRIVEWERNGFRNFFLA